MPWHAAWRAWARHAACQAPFPGAGKHPKRLLALMTRTCLSDFPLDSMAPLRIVRASMNAQFTLTRHATHMCMHKHMPFAAPWSS